MRFVKTGISFGFLPLLLTSLAAQPLDQTFYFPQFEIRTSAPSDWHARNESHGRFGNILVTKEKLSGDDSIYTVGISIQTNVEEILKRKVFDNQDLHAEINHLFSTTRTFNKPFKLKTSIGDMDAYEGDVMNNIGTHFVQAVLKTDQTAYWIYYEAPTDLWKKYEPVLRKIAETVQWTSKPDRNDQIVPSIYNAR